MTELNTPEYYRRREAQERALADKATSAAIADIHQRMADKYHALAGDAELAGDLGARRPALPIVMPR